MKLQKKQKIHILGICGTFMGGLAVLARSLGYQVSGADQNVYPPMSTQLASLNITMQQGYDTELIEDYDEVVIGNVMTRSMTVIESLLNSSQHYTSGPQWLGEHLLRHKKVFAVAGTHGKTTTASMLAWILEDNNQNPGFLIGGIAQNFNISARNTQTESFVIEADEYDSAFFDKRSKFVHYHANIAILNNLEYDHADIFPNLDAIKTQFHHFIRTIPNTGVIIVNHEDKNLAEVLNMGCWSPTISFGTDAAADIWAQATKSDFSQFDVYYHGQKRASIDWELTGKHNMLNGIAAMIAALQQDVALADSAQSLNQFQGIKRRMEFIGAAQNIKIYDDFAHHPTAIATTIEGVKNKLDKIEDTQLVVVFEPRSNSMRAGTHAQALPTALKDADIAIVMNYPNLKWQEDILAQLQSQNIQSFSSVEKLIAALSAMVKTMAKKNAYVIFMSNGSFANAPRRLLQQLQC
ncbi:UDP-N-acetylmuramate:L-alanyl-gamma-D-glutamyl-meso-diaminopimelate ligase [hydrothermal vent metagenome]|uniref:UDP-N-acetylmuramate:L-alanyl-gamma-D-glutamyl-meso-diaminopimelate ligase n=1 Tax=hydrothermal vent metagenome TaxID=652676 RepID=A0A3B0V195_9ZZZZ